jgi:hypothetical protein
MRSIRRLAMATIVCTLGLGAAAPSSFAALFIGYENGHVGRIDVDGTDQTALVNAGLVLDVATTSTHVYWTRNGSIGRARLDGSQVDSSFAVTGAPAGGLGLDATHVYWVDEDAGTIRRASLADGAVDGAWSITGAGEPQDVAVGGGFVYWT